MMLTEEQKQAITNEYNKFVEVQYAGKTKKERQELGAFFTPPQLTIRMIEKFTNLEGTILDPTCGAGGLLAAVILAGADPTKCYGIELDPAIANVAKERLGKLGVSSSNIKVGDALLEGSYDFYAVSSSSVPKIIDSNKQTKPFENLTKMLKKKDDEDLQNFKNKVKEKINNLKHLKEKGFEPPSKWEWWDMIFDKIIKDLQL